MMKERLRQIVNNKPEAMSTEDRAFVRECAKALGVKIKNTRCKSCYHDAAFECYAALLKTEKQQETNDTREYILRDGVDLLFGNIRVNAATITDELAERIIARGFETKYFIKCK